VINLQDGGPRDRRYISLTVKRLPTFRSVQIADGGRRPERKAIHHNPVPRLRMSGAMPPYSPMRLHRILISEAQGRFNLSVVVKNTWDYTLTPLRLQCVTTNSTQRHHKSQNISETSKLTTYRRKLSAIKVKRFTSYRRAGNTELLSYQTLKMLYM
jgi:hypothetical protein